MKPKGSSNIAFLVPHVGGSGAEVTLEQLLRGLPQDVFTIHLVSPPGQSLKDVAQSIGCELHIRKFSKFPSTSIEIGEHRLINPFAILFNIALIFLLGVQLNIWVRKNNIQILYTISTLGHLIGAIACIFTSCTLIWHVHEILSKTFAGGLGRVIFGLVAYYFVDHIITPSKAVAGSILYMNKITVIESAIEIEKYTTVETSTLRSELNLDAVTPIIGVIGRLTTWKGQHLCVEAAAQLRNRGLKVHFVIVGSAIFSKQNYFKELENLTKRLSAQDLVTFLGFRRDIPNIIKGLDIVVVPSIRPEPFGLVAVEGMATGKPVIGSNGGGLAEIIIHEQTGLLFTMGNLDEFTQAIEKLILSPILQAQYGQAGLERARYKYAVERYVSESINFLEQILK